MNHATAIHEAGHAVAHVRLGILQDAITIVPHEGVLGSAKAEGAESVWSAEEAASQVLAYCAGYAAMIAAGYADADAREGADADFEHATELISFWNLKPDLVGWRERAVAMMQEPQNIAAVALVADHLLRERALDGDFVSVLVDFADGAINATDFDAYLQLRQSARA